MINSSYGKLVEGNIIYAPNPIVINNIIYYHPKEEIYLQQGYLLVIDTPHPEGDKYYIYEWIEKDNKIIKTWFEAEPPGPTIEELKEQLANTDYKIIKCSEYSLAGQELPYDIVALHAERQAIRDKINDMQ